MFTIGHFPDFEVTVHNTTESNFISKRRVSGGQVCYSHNNSIPQSTKIYVTCNGSRVGNLIRLQLHSKALQLVLCDFRLYGGEKLFNLLDFYHLTLMMF
jgi:hypothetical protein